MFHSSSSRSNLNQSYSQHRSNSSGSGSHGHGHHAHSSSRTHSNSHSRPVAHESRPRPDYPVTDAELWRVFNQVDADHSGAISVTELQRALKNGTLLAHLGFKEPQLKTGNPTEDWQPFDLDTVKMLMNYFDKDHNGTITFDEFAGLFKYIYEWQQVFKYFDRDNSRTIDQSELKAALDQFGYPLGPDIYKLILKKYASMPETNYGPPPGITFDRFVRACVAIKWLSDSFYRHDADRDGWVTMNYEQFMKIFFEAP